MHRLLPILFILMALPSFAEQRTSGMLVNLLYPTDSLADVPSKRLGWFVLREFPFTLTAHKKHGRFEDFIRPLRYEGHGLIHVPRGGTHSVVVDAQAPPVLFFGRTVRQEKRRLRSRWGIPDDNPLRRYQPDRSQPRNMADQAFYECQVYVDVAGKRVTSLRVASEFDQQFSYDPLNRQHGLSEYGRSYTTHDFNRQRCGFREQNVGTIHLPPGTHEIRFGAQCASAAAFLPEALYQNTEFVPVGNCPRDTLAWREPNSYPGNGVLLNLFVRKPGTGEPLPISPVDVYHRRPRP